MDSFREHKLHQQEYRFVNRIENYAKIADTTMRLDNFVDIKESLEEIQKKHPQYKSKGGIPFFYNNATVYVDASDAHNIIIGSTGSKKTRLIVMPSVKIMAYTGESMIIADPKAEVYERTARDLKNHGYRIYVINFRNPEEGDCWNPLEIPFRFFKEGKLNKAREYANDIAINLALTEIGHSDPYWDRSAYNLLFALIQLAFIIGKDNESVSMRDVLELRAAIFGKDNEVNNEYIEIAKVDNILYHSFLGTINAPGRTRSSILSVFDQKVSCFSYQEDLAEMMDINTINLDNMGYEKSAIFLIMPDEKTTYHQLVSLFIKQSYEYLINLAQQRERHSFPIRINYILDEFSNLPAIKDFPAMISAARSRNIRFSLIIQSFQQLISKYKSDADTIKGNCTNLVYLNSRELNVLEEISALCGTQESNKELFSIFGLQHLDKEKGQAVVLSGRLFPFVTELKDIREFDNDSFEYLPIKKRKESKDYKSFTYDFEQRIKELEKKGGELELQEKELIVQKKEIEAKEKELQIKSEELEKKEKELEKTDNSKIHEEKVLISARFCQYGTYFVSILTMVLGLYNKALLNGYWNNNTIISTCLISGVVVLLYFVCILSIRPGINEIILLCIPIIVEFLRIMFFGMDLDIITTSSFMTLIYYIALVLPFADYSKTEWKLKKYNFIIFTFLNILLMIFLLYFSFSMKTWYNDINGIIFFGILTTSVFYNILKLAKSIKNFKVDDEDIMMFSGIIIVTIYLLFTVAEYLILFIHTLKIF